VAKLAFRAATDIAALIGQVAVASAFAVLNCAKDLEILTDENANRAGENNIQVFTNVTLVEDGIAGVESEQFKAEQKRAPEIRRQLFECLHLRYNGKGPELQRVGVRAGVEREKDGVMLVADKSLFKRDAISEFFMVDDTISRAKMLSWLVGFHVAAKHDDKTRRLRASGGNDLAFSWLLKAKATCDQAEGGELETAERVAIELMEK
jgi:hypothetical protein